MTYDELNSRAESLKAVGNKCYYAISSAIKLGMALGVSADDCLALIKEVLESHKDNGVCKEVYKLDKETKHRIIDGGFYTACREMAKQSDAMDIEEGKEILWFSLEFTWYGDSFISLTDKAKNNLN